MYLKEEIQTETLVRNRPGFEPKLRVRERKHPKWSWCAPGLVRAMRRTRGTLAPEERGALFEGLVAQVLRAHRDYDALCDEIAFWSAERRSTEVDFVLTRGDEHLAIEVKSGRTMIGYPEGPTLKTADGIEVLPFAELASRLDQRSLW